MRLWLLNLLLPKGWMLLSPDEIKMMEEDDEKQHENGFNDGFNEGLNTSLEGEMFSFKGVQCVFVKYPKSIKKTTISKIN